MACKDEPELCALSWEGGVLLSYPQRLSQGDSVCEDSLVFLNVTAAHSTDLNFRLHPTTLLQTPARQ